MWGWTPRPKKVEDPFIIRPLRVTLRALVITLNRYRWLAKRFRRGPDEAHTPMADRTGAVHTLHTDGPSGDTHDLAAYKQTDVWEVY